MAQHDLKGFVFAIIVEKATLIDSRGFIQSFHAFSGLICNRFDDFQGNGCGQPYNK